MRGRKTIGGSIFTSEQLASIERIEAAFQARNEGRAGDIPTELVFFVYFGRDKASWPRLLQRTEAMDADKLNQPKTSWPFFPFTAADIRKVARARPGR